MLFFPLPCTYAVVEIDVKKTLESLADPIADAAGASIKTTKCIVYLNMVLQLPFPDDATFKYMVYLVGPGLRPEDPELCITPDMCIPISPNTQHPLADREALKSNPPFPYHNCYHWLGPDMWLDLRICNDGRDYSLAPRTQLPAIEHVELGSIGGQDMWRSICARKEMLDARCAAELAELPFADIELEDEPEASPPRQSTSPVRALSPSAAVSSEQETAPVVFISEVRHGDEGESERRQHVCEDCGECHSEYGSEYSDGDSSESRSPVYQCSERLYASEEALEEMNVFGLGGDEGDDLLPIVSISLDIGAHFISDEDVPDPREFMRQRDELVKIIQESKARAKACKDAESEFIATSEFNLAEVYITDSVEPCEATPPVGPEEAECSSASIDGSTEGAPQPKGFWSMLASASASIL